MIELTEPGKLDLRSMDITEEQKSKLKQIFPHIFNEDNIDFDKLRQTLGEEVDEGQERYGMTWPGKSECFKVIQQSSKGTLKPCREESVNFDQTENLFIEGDNLEALKILQKSYYGKIKMIYIDPPYNTGKEFIYPDKYSETLDTYLAYTGQINDEGMKFSTNTETEGRFHSKWLNMMYPRLFLARNLLRDDGVLFVSIDDKEVANLKKICDEIFGEENRVGTLVWKNVTDNNPSQIVVEHEYIHVYARQLDRVDSAWRSKISDIKDRLSEVGKDFISQYDNQEERQEAYTKWFKENKPYLWPLDRYKYIDENGIYTGSQSVHNPGKEGYRYDVPHPKTGKACKQPLMGYRFPSETMDQLLTEDRVLFGDDENKIIELKVYAEEFEDKLSSVVTLDGRLGAYDLRDLFPESSKIFTNPKPVRLLSELISFLVNDGDLFLDFFSGSCASAHAILYLNKSDSGKRRFIMVQLPEPVDLNTDAGKNALKLGFKNISEIGKERVRRVIKKFEDERNERSIQRTLFETDSKVDLKKLDLGFKVFKLDKSNFDQWDGSIEVDTTGDKIIKQLQLAIENINPTSSEEDILYELLLKSGFSLTTKIDEIEIAGKKIYSIENDALLICLSRELSKEIITEMARKEPSRVICLDDGFAGNDQLKTNTVQIMKSFGVEDFRTV